ncbi:ribosome biogenesis GTPase Der, partial [Candidatus Falkowbacteria bacterium CG10_big_fil_rev_8_21_14_0_10_37_6]
MSIKEPIKNIPHNLPVVVIFGRTNVGKSTLFNKLNGKSQAIVARIAGTTRDSNEAVVDWQGKKFQLVDTGGIIDEKFLSGKHKLKKMKLDEQNIDTLVQQNVKRALKKADVILFTVDAKTGLMEQDKNMTLLLKKMIDKKQKIILVANKIDSPKDRLNQAAFYSLALGEPMSVSAATGSGTGDLLDAICNSLNLKITNEVQNDKQTIKVVILGKPNVGKSSLLNAILGENKVIVSAHAHTTREPQDITIEYKNNQIKFIDTAGIVKHTSKATKDPMIKIGISKSLSSLKKCDIALLVIDIADELSHQETKLTDNILQDKVNLIIVANKWDKIEDKDAKTTTKQIYTTLPFVQWAPIIFLSALHKTKTTQLMDMILSSFAARNKQISGDALEEFMKSALRHAAPLSRAKVNGILKHKLPKPHLKSIEQIRVSPPEFKL